VIDVRFHESLRSRHTGLETLLAVSIIDGSSARIREHVVGLGHEGKDHLATFVPFPGGLVSDGASSVSGNERKPFLPMDGPGTLIPTPKRDEREESASSPLLTPP